MSDPAKNESQGSPEKGPQENETVCNELSPGAQLSARRLALNLSVEQVASQLNFAPRQIQAIEADNYAALPGMAIIRGFIRSYAKLLGVDAAPLLEVLAKEATAAEKAAPLRRKLSNVRFSESRLSPPGSMNKVLRSILGLLLLVLLAGGLFSMQRSGMLAGLPSFFQSGSEDAPAVQGLDDRPQTPPSGTPGSDKNGGDPSGNTPANEVAANVSVVNGQNAAQTASQVAGQIAATEPAVVAPASTPGAGAADMLTLTMREDSWVEIRRPDNSTLVAALLKAGTTESYKINGPVSMTIGNAAGVDAILRGKPVALKPDGKTNVARLTLK